MRTLARVTGLVLLAGVLSTATANASTRVFVRFGPPPIVIEHRPPAPYPYYAWRPGYHRWSGTRYTWVRGEYVRPPYRHAHWHPGYWRHEHRGYIWVNGYWR